MALVELRGLDVHDVDGIYLEVTRGFRVPYGMRGIDYIVAAAPGRFPGNRVSDVLSILLEGYVDGANAEDWAANRDALMFVLDENEYTEPGLLVVRAPLYGLAEGTSSEIAVRVENIVEGPITAYQKQTYSIALTAVGADGWTVSES